MNRRLPVYLLLDTSSSMSGEPLEAVKNGLDMLVSSLRKDPQALETAYLSVIEFNSVAKQLEPLKELSDFQVPPLEANGMTAMGESLIVLSQCIEKEVVNSSQKGYRPMVFMFTDGSPTDDLKKGIEALKKVKLAIFVACAAGPSADITQLKKITEAIVRLDQTDSASIAAFFKWVSSSISVSSQKIEAGQTTNEMRQLPAPPPEVNIIDLTKS